MGWPVDQAGTAHSQPHAHKAAQGEADEMARGASQRRDQRSCVLGQRVEEQHSVVAQAHQVAGVGPQDDGVAQGGGSVDGDELGGQGMATPGAAMLCSSDRRPSGLPPPSQPGAGALEASRLPAQRHTQPRVAFGFVARTTPARSPRGYFKTAGSQTLIGFSIL
jgi:hypothetical protein